MSDPFATFHTPLDEAAIRPHLMQMTAPTDDPRWPPGYRLEVHEAGVNAIFWVVQDADGNGIATLGCVLDPSPVGGKSIRSLVGWWQRQFFAFAPSPSYRDDPALRALAQHVQVTVRKLEAEGSRAKRVPVQRPPRSKADRWLIREFFDVYDQKRPLKEFMPEWTEMRKEEDENKKVSDPLDTMKKIIGKERRRRTQR